MESNEYALWIDSLLESARENPQQSVTELLTSCGKACGMRKGWVAAMSQLRQAACDCQSRKDYVNFLNAALPVRFEEVKDGIVQHLGNGKCNCPMAEKIQHPVLCNCTLGNSTAMWSTFFGRTVKVEIIETVFRGGKECAFKICV